MPSAVFFTVADAAAIGVRVSRGTMRPFCGKEAVCGRARPCTDSGRLCAAGKALNEAFSASV